MSKPVRCVYLCVDTCLQVFGFVPRPEDSPRDQSSGSTFLVFTDSSLAWILPDRKSPQVHHTQALFNVDSGYLTLGLMLARPDRAKSQSKAGVSAVNTAHNLVCEIFLRK